MSIPKKIVFYTLPHSPNSLQLSFSNQTSGDIYASCSFNNTTSIVKYEKPLVNLTLSEFIKTNDFDKKILDTLNLYEILSQRVLYEPRKFGLVVKKLSKPVSTSQFRNLQEKSSFCKELLQESDRIFWSGVYGWFHPKSNPKKFGTLFLIPTSILGKTEWVLMQMGIEEAVEKVAWNDKDGIIRLAEKCGEDPDLLLTVKALQDSENLRKKTKEYEYKEKILQARESFSPKINQIRPRLTEKCVVESAEEIFGRKYMVRTSCFDLRPYSVFGWKTTKEERVAPIWGAALITFQTIQSENIEKLDEIYELLQYKLQQKNLGIVLKQYETENTFPTTTQNNIIKSRIHVQTFFEPKMWIVKNKEVFFTNIEVFLNTNKTNFFLEEKETFTDLFQQYYKTSS